MIDPTVRLADRHDADDVAQLELLEGEARKALEGQRGGNRYAEMVVRVPTTG